MSKHFHQLAMALIILGAVGLFYMAFLWFGRGNNIMGAGMLIMGIIATSNFYLHMVMMKKM